MPAVQAGDEAAADLFFSWVIPGRLAGARAPITDRDLRVLSDLGISLLVRLTEARFVTTEQIQEAGLDDFHEPVPDFGVPTLEQARRIVECVQRTMISGQAAVISCFAGHGRTGTMLSCCLVAQGLSADAAFQFMDLIGRPHSETEEQRESVRRFASAWARGELARIARGDPRAPECTALIETETGIEAEVHDGAVSLPIDGVLSRELAIDPPPAEGHTDCAETRAWTAVGRIALPDLTVRLTDVELGPSRAACCVPEHVPCSGPRCVPVPGPS